VVGRVLYTQRVPLSAQKGWLPLFLAIGLLYPVSAAEVVFENGQVARGVTVASETATHIAIMMPEGMVRYPKQAIRSIDGRPLSPALETPEPTPTTAQPTATPSPVPVVTTPLVAAPEPASSEPAPTEVLQVEEQKPPPEPAQISREYRWNVELLLLGLLFLSGVWMRSLQWVQRDLYAREGDPRFWSLLALVLPGLGAAIYWLVAFFGDGFHRKRALSPNVPSSSGPPSKSPWMLPPADPAAFLAGKGKTRKGFEFLDSGRKSIKVNDSGDAASGLATASEMLEEALLEKASDIHIEPTSEDYRVRFRLDGLMHERMSYSLSDGLRLVTSLKSLAEIDIAEKRKAQDGRFRAHLSGRDVDFRLATANSIHGEKLVIRVLDHGRGILDLTSLGMSEDMLATFQSVIRSRNGMILATGPTGSGKTSTLYAALRELDATRMNIMTIEDPAEYELPGATQIAVNPRAGVTYESGLRSILRQDPDVILVGEMRDKEATEVTLRAALTGHLVLSSLHTKDAVGTISRLQDMGIERYQVASALLMIIAQRLVRVLCPHCRQPYEAAGDELDSLGFSFESGTILYKPGACEHCLNTGFSGRTGLFELLVINEDLRKSISEGMNEAELAALATTQGFRSYHYDGAEKCLLGITTVEEVLQAV